MTKRLTPKQEAQLRQPELAETPEQSTSRIVAEFVAYPELWETAELSAEEELIDATGGFGDEEDMPDLALYLHASGADNVALMQLAIH
jgi:hypothetical protein